MNLSELIEEFREVELYNTNPEDWMGILESDDCWETVGELAY